MKQFFMILFVHLLLAGCGSDDKPKEDPFLLSISPIIDHQDATNQKIIQSLKEFLMSKNSSLTENPYWLPSDFDRFVHPYLDIYKIESSRLGEHFFRPTLMEIMPTDHDDRRIVKVAFIGHHPETSENQLKSIFNLIANIDEDGILFSRYLNHATEDWQMVSHESMTYIISPQKVIDYKEIQEQLADIGRLCMLFGTEPIDITYYSCVNPGELFEIKGFDYHPMMYVSKTGGLADYGNLVFSGNHSELYTHEIVHIYTSNLFPGMDKFLDEGIATYIAGSGLYTYEWHRSKMIKYLRENPEFDFSAHMDPYERLYFEEETPIPYLIAALICEHVHRRHGREKLVEWLSSIKDVWPSLATIGLTPKNINDELRKELDRPLFPIW